ncbi:MAG: hypothetical protein AAFU71_13510 [Cyanobacteria bacterium J06632_22]
MSIAPHFLNSHYPLLGVFIWLIVALGWFLYGSTVILRWLRARQSRQLFLSQYPQYQCLTWVHFLSVSTQQVNQDLETLNIAQTDPDYQSLNLSISLLTISSPATKNENQKVCQTRSFPQHSEHPRQQLRCYPRYQ